METKDLQQRVGLLGGRELGDSCCVRGAEIPEGLPLCPAEQVLPNVPPLEVAEPRISERVAEPEGALIFHPPPPPFPQRNIEHAFDGDVIFFCVFLRAILK